jgi:hypothetical protein
MIASRGWLRMNSMIFLRFEEMIDCCWIQWMYSMEVIPSWLVSMLVGCWYREVDSVSTWLISSRSTALHAVLGYVGCVCRFKY